MISGDLNRSFEAEGFFDKTEIVVDCFRHADNADVCLTPVRCLRNCLSPFQCAITADAKQEIDLSTLELVDHGFWILVASMIQEWFRPVCESVQQQMNSAG